MADTTYTPTFKHVDWVDNEDVVEAGGENGFNARFHALETEFARLSTAIRNINAAIVPVDPTVTLAFSPSFFTLDNNEPWKFGDQIAIVRLPDQVGAVTDAFLPVQLPDGTNVQSITIFGSHKGVELFFGLSSQLLNTADRMGLTSVNVAGTTSGDFEVTGEVLSNLNSVDNSINRYFVFARATRASADDTAFAFVYGIRIVCKRP